MSIGVPIKLLHEAQGHIITIELKTGSVYRGTLFEGKATTTAIMDNNNTHAFNKNFATCLAMTKQKTRFSKASCFSQLHGRRKLTQEAKLLYNLYTLIAEDNMNVQLKDITMTARDGRLTQLDQVYIRGSHIRFFIVPDMLKNAPMFKQQGAASMKGKGIGLGRGKATVARAQGKSCFLLPLRQQVLCCRAVVCCSCNMSFVLPSFC